MKTYDSYKPSGVDWIGNIPEGWECMKLKYNLSLKGRIGWNGLKSDEFKTTSYAYLVTGQDFRGAEIEWAKCYQIDKERYDEDPFIQLKNGDLLVTKDGTIGKIAKVSGLDKPACLNSGIFVIKQIRNAFDTSYLYWYLSSDLLKKFNMYAYPGTTIQHLYQNVFENMPMLLPPLSVQREIAGYLDKKVGEIDGIIKGYEEQIADLKAYRSSTISEAVTRGLDPNATLKPSGVEWIGNIPTGWEVRRIHHIFRAFGSGTTPDTNDTSYYENGNYNWLQTGDLNDGEVFVTKKKITEKAFKEYSTLKIYPRGSLVVAMYAGATIGKVGLTRIETATNQACCVLVPSEKVASKYAFYALIASKQSLINKAAGGAQPNISQGIIRQHPIPLPPLSEQEAIAGYLDKKVGEIDGIIKGYEEQIADLKAFRSSTISEVVTGKVKVIDEKTA